MPRAFTSFSLSNVTLGTEAINWSLGVTSTDFVHVGTPVSVAQRSIGVAFLVPVIIVGFLGNSLVLASVAKYPHLRTSSNLLVVSLAVSDIFTSTVLTGIIVVAYATNGRSFGYQTHGNSGNLLCQIFGFLMMQSGICSTMCMTLIAINRYFIVCKKQGVLKAISKRWTVLLSVCAHLYGFVFAAIPLLGISSGYHFKQVELICLFDASGKGINFFIAGIIFNFSLPYPTIIYCYMRIWMAIRKGKRETHPQSLSQRNINKRNIMVTKSLFFAFLTYTLCITPHYWFYMVDPRKGAPFGVSSLFFVNSTMNSLIYGWKNPSFRRSYGKILRRFGSSFSDWCRWECCGGGTSSSADAFTVSSQLPHSLDP
ncbi:melatonin receptor type 1A-like [Ptychodera flava]|uniref:melatonin receptor type 1A-like n=1 Tax=Ptychodera flava TaxID=63121 RepID=UPI00396A0FCC